MVDLPFRKKYSTDTLYDWRIPLLGVFPFPTRCMIYHNGWLYGDFSTILWNFGCQNRCLSAGEEAEAIFRTLTQFSSSCVTLVSSQKVPLAWEQRCNATQDEPQCFANPQIQINFDNSDL